METPDWLLLVSKEGIIEAVDGGAPAAWISRSIDECLGLPEDVRIAAHKLVRALAHQLASPLVRRVRVPPGRPFAPAFTLLTVEAILLRPTDVALAPLLRRALEPLKRQAGEAEISLRIEMAEDIPAQISLDASRITWAVTTLVGNALRYVRRGSRVMPGGNVSVLVVYKATNPMVSITVKDDGPGIPASVRTEVLAARPVDGEGTSVSLRLIHDLVVAHGGGMVIKSSSAEESCGTAVTLLLPVHR